MKRPSILAVIAALGTVLAPWQAVADEPTREDLFRNVQLALSSAQLSVQIGNIAAVDKKNFPACLTTLVLQSSFEAGEEFLKDGGVKIPRLRVDVSRCAQFQEALPPAVLREEVLPMIENAVSIPIEALKAILARRPPPDASCEDMAVLGGLLSYLRLLSKPILKELAEPDGRMRVPSLPIDLSGCGQGPDETPRNGESDEPPPTGESATGRAVVETSSPSAESAAEPTPSATKPDIATRLQKLKDLLAAGLITTDDYERRKAEILADL